MYACTCRLQGSNFQLWTVLDSLSCIHCIFVECWCQVTFKGYITVPVLNMMCMGIWVSLWSLPKLTDWNFPVSVVANLNSETKLSYSMPQWKQCHGHSYYTNSSKWLLQTIKTLWPGSFKSYTANASIDMNMSCYNYGGHRHVHTMYMHSWNERLLVNEILRYLSSSGYSRPSWSKCSGVSMKEGKGMALSEWAGGGCRWFEERGCQL